jgi:putative flippase GtrA
MTAVPEKIAHAAWRLIPAPIERKMRTEAGKRFTRFAGVAIAAVITSQVMLGLLTGPINLSAGLSGVLAGMSAALVSYVLSRWAWDRKGKPDLLRETLPFWAVSVAVWLILGLTSHYASVWAHSHDYTHVTKHLIVQGAYLLMNCVTFVGRFLILHYVLFAPKKAAKHAGPPAELATADATTHAQDASAVALLTGDSPAERQARHRA